MASADRMDQDSNSNLRRIFLAKNQINWKFFVPKDGFRFSDYLAFTSLIISASGAIYGLIGWYRGPQLDFRPPELVSFRCYEATKVNDEWVCGRDTNVMITGTSMTYTNSGRHDYNGSVIKETAILDISGRDSASLDWAEFSNVTTLSSEGKVAVATEIPGNSAIAHETRFFAREIWCKDCEHRKNFVPWNEFIGAIVDKNRSVSVVFNATLFDGHEMNKSYPCKIFLTDQSRAEFAARPPVRITSLPCNYE
jgi:hypothetical protein